MQHNDEPLADFEQAYQEGSDLWSGDEAIDRAVGAALDRWEARTGWRPDFAVIQGYCIAIDKRCVELQAENDRLKAALVADGQES